jgi:hypothetical protein
MANLLHVAGEIFFISAGIFAAWVIMDGAHQLFKKGK